MFNHYSQLRSQKWKMLQHNEHLYNLWRYIGTKHRHLRWNTALILQGYKTISNIMNNLGEKS